MQTFSMEEELTLQRRGLLGQTCCLQGFPFRTLGAGIGDCLLAFTNWNLNLGKMNPLA
jgi:hypothetical protein